MNELPVDFNLLLTLVAQPADAYDKRLTCLICDRPKNEADDSVELVVVVKSKYGPSIAKGLHQQCWEKTNSYYLNWMKKKENVED